MGIASELSEIAMTTLLDGYWVRVGVRTSAVDVLPCRSLPGCIPLAYT
jgi:hypothetical protein